MSGTVIVRPSTSSTTNAASVSETRCARASLMSLSGAEVLIPCPQQQMLPLDHQPLKSLELRGDKASATCQPYRFEPELRPVCLPLHVNMRWFIAVCRVEEEPVRTLAMNRRHNTSVPLVAARSGNSGTALNEPSLASVWLALRMSRAPSRSMPRRLHSSVRRLYQCLIDQGREGRPDIRSIGQKLDHQQHDEACLRVHSIHRTISATPPERALRVHTLAPNRSVVSKPRPNPRPVAECSEPTWFVVISSTVRGAKMRTAPNAP